MAAQHIDTEWHELRDREQILFRLHAAVAEADRRAYRARLVRASRISERVAPRGRVTH
jgi:hypothetical protein